MGSGTTRVRTFFVGAEVPTDSRPARKLCRKQQRDSIVPRTITTRWTIAAAKCKAAEFHQRGNTSIQHRYYRRAGFYNHCSSAHRLVSARERPRPEHSLANTRSAVDERDRFGPQLRQIAFTHSTSRPRTRDHRLGSSPFGDQNEDLRRIAEESCAGSHAEGGSGM